ncbi:MAG: cytochrome c-type biogenesis protein CcmH [Rhodospirillales bacterium CG15_BIG_FIL_POST_REV_8_21_14_020_66_15]|nr:MAG: cytochrome c-type biogenesis protein CcmH [Rhodospirillales bacterium CG15_BIG_FIL_POST_REV_8_21_14_020_66_15]
MTRVLVLAALLAVLLPAGPARAVNPDEMLADPVLEARARDISKELRCLVCQNQSIDDSDAGLAKDLRVLVRERLKAGDSDDQVVAFVVARYGDFVLLKPPVKGSTLVLWAGPAVVAGLGILAVVVFFRRRRAAPAAAAPLTAEERARLNKLLEGDAP